MEYPNNYPYLTPDEKEMLEMYRKCTPEMKAEIDKRLLLMAIENKDDDVDPFPALNME